MRRNVPGNADRRPLESEGEVEREGDGGAGGGDEGGSGEEEGGEVVERESEEGDVEEVQGEHLEVGGEGFVGGGSEGFEEWSFPPRCES